MRTLFLVFMLLLLSCFFLSAQQTITGSFVFDGQERDYRLRIPPESFSGARPLIFNLHGFGSNAFQQEAYAQMNPVADTAGLFICYPNGVDNAWNVGWAFGSTADDVGFIGALIDTIAATHAIDLERVYSCGMSNGGFMSYRLACELNDRIAAVASVTGSMVPAYVADCMPGRTVPVLEIHGTADATVPYGGQPSLAISIEDLLSFWNLNNQCDGDPVIQELPNTDATDESTVTKIQSTGCAERGEVLHYRINAGGHTWPGAPINIGVTNQDINGSTEIWHFFRGYTLSGISSASFAEALPVELFPNPATDEVQIRLPAPGGELSLYSSSGKQLLQTTLWQTVTGLDVSGYPAGLYFVRIRQQGTFQTMKLILQ